MIIRNLIHETGNLLRSLKSNIYKRAGITIGKNCMISLNAKLDVRRGTIKIGNNVTITYGCVILSHDRAAALLSPNEKSSGCTVIEDDVFVGVNSVIMKNVRLGKGCIIGAGSIVTHDIPPYSIAVGNPARVVSMIGKNL